MSSNSSVLPGALWATPKEADTTRPISWTRAILGGLLIEAGLLGALGAMAMTESVPVQPEIIMQVEMAPPKPPPPPPPPPKEIVKQKPIVQKTITRKIVMEQPKPVPPQPVVEPTLPTPEPVIAAAERPSADAPAVATPKPASGPAHGPSAPVAMTLACPVQVAPEMPAKALAMGIAGRVVARAKIQSGKVISVDILKSEPPGVFDAAVKSAMMRYQCENNSTDIVAADQTFNFTLN
ncbi:MAG: tonB [Herbaspirillum sp.]|jgi:protein TonB|nr:tonB [Herbaspirillum sp.]